MTLTEELEVVTRVHEPLVMGRYRLGRRLGAGGFGAVHEAVDERLDRWVAVKVIPADGTAPERARREAIAAARLEHPGIVSVFDAGEEDGYRYLVSELVEGRTLGQLIVAGELSDRDVLRIGLALCDALEHAHERGVVHRDVKPANVLVPFHPRSWRDAAKLADFGVAMLAGDDPLTMTGDVVGTLAYMAPEQAAGKKVGHLADVYSLAIVLYEALAGHNPNRGDSPAATARRVGRPVPSLADARPDLPDALCDAIDDALRIAPFERPELAELGDALEDALIELPDEGGTIVEHPAERGSLLPEVPPGTPRILHAVMTGALVTGALLLGSDVGAVPLGVAAAVGVGLLPRVGWVLAAIGTIFALFAGEVAAGVAGAIILGVLPIPLLLSRAPVAWSVPAIAPLLGFATIAGAFPALLGMARGFKERAALGALGAWWLLLTEPLAGHTLLLGPAVGSPNADGARGGLSLLGEAVTEAVTAGLPVLLVIWALAAGVLPWLVRGRSTALDIVGAAFWAATLAASTAAIVPWLGDSLTVTEPRGLVAGAIVGGAAAVFLARRDQRYLPDDDWE